MKMAENVILAPYGLNWALFRANQKIFFSTLTITAYYLLQFSILIGKIGQLILNMKMALNLILDSFWP